MRHEHGDKVNAQSGAQQSVHCCSPSMIFPPFGAIIHRAHAHAGRVEDTLR